MALLNENLLEDSDFVQDIYQVQTRAFSPIEYPYLTEIIRSHSVKNVLDIGTGEGNFITGLASLMPEVRFTAIDGDARLIGVAEAQNTQSNLSFSATLFDQDFPPEPYDLILARFAVEHMTDTSLFVQEAVKRLHPGGILLVTEYYCEYLERDHPMWQLFRKKEIELYTRLNSRPYTSVFLPRTFRDAGLTLVSSLFHHLTPSTIGDELFYMTVVSYIRGYRKIMPSVFTEEVCQPLLDYFAGDKPNTGCSEDRLFLTHTFGIKP